MGQENRIIVTLKSKSRKKPVSVPVRAHVSRPEEDSFNCTS